jgi:hypothetical protein
MRHTREAEYTEYVAARLDWLRRTAFLGPNPANWASQPTAG